MRRLPLRPRFAGLLLILTSFLTPPTSVADAGLVLPGLDGGRLSEADLGAGPMILVVWASWSPRCRDVAPRLAALAKTWSPTARVASVVFQEEPAKIRDFLAGTDLGAPVYIDETGAFSKKHAVATLPTLLVFRDGETVFRGKLPVDAGPVIERALGLSPSE